MITVGRTFIRQGGSIARGTTIDAYLSEEDNAMLYEAWDKSWAEPYEFHGGIKAISAEMIVEVPEDEFLGVFRSKFGRKKSVQDAAIRILEAARTNAGR